jgi:hypothetical protein
MIEAKNWDQWIIDEINKPDIFIIHYAEAYSDMKDGKNPYIIFKGELYQYNKGFGTYRWYRKGKTPISINREEILNRLGNYLRRIKLEKIRSKI